jgi:hypothetical protein
VYKRQQHLLQRWLREVHNIHIFIEVFKIEGITKYAATILSDMLEEDDVYTYFNTYEEALEEALVNALNLI